MISIFSSKRIDLFRKLNFTNKGTIGLVKLRSRLLPLIKNNNLFKKIDVDLSNLLKSWFNRGFLITNPITWNTSAKILEKIIKYEAVHQIKSWEDLRSRLEPIDRRCYGFFHPTMYDEPLIFVEVALMDEVPSSIYSILNTKRKHIASKDFTTAVFYSISNCQKGLKGISFGNFLIKQVVMELKKEFPYLKTFVTLSPAPMFSKWLKEKDIKLTKKLINSSSLNRKESEILAYAKEYFFKAKQNDNYPIDPVQRFHLSNGAILENIHLNADLSQNGIKNSLGLMVNYKYDLDSIEQNHEEYFSKMSIPASKKLNKLTVIPLRS
jgi:malonyl-CoA decarboxylase